MGLFSARKTATLAGSPTQAVQQAIAQGISARHKIAEVTGLQRSTVDVILDRMERTGQLRREAMGGMCLGTSCSSCGMSTGGACAGGTVHNGPVALVLTHRERSGT